MEALDPIALFKRSAADMPDLPALRVDGITCTYAQLDRWSDAIAHELVNAGAKNERVAFIAHRQTSSYALILGILKAGCSYVPLHPDGPEARWRTIIRRCGARCFIGDRSPVDGLQRIGIPSANGTADPFPSTADPQREAYVLFTSGSTGGPKGVSVSRTNVAAYLQHMRLNYRFGPDDRFTQLFALTFDLSVHDLFMCWSAGACLCVPPEMSGLRIASYVREEGITIWFSVPSLPVMMQRMRSLTPGSLPSIRHAFFCGEALTYGIASAFQAAAPNARLTNLYGPTETTIAISSFELDRPIEGLNGVVPIGRIFSGNEGIVIDGELWISGPQVSAGYVNDPPANSHAFRQLRGSRGRWYLTGDRVEEGRDGTLHYLGRADDQVKVLGHRVEPGEVDALIGPLLGGGRSVTVPVVEAGGTRLATFIDVRIDTDPLLAQCREVLPPYMVPVRIQYILEWPFTTHGKTDRKRLIAMASYGR